MRDFEGIDISRDDVEAFARRRDEDVLKRLCTEPADIVAPVHSPRSPGRPGAMRVLCIIDHVIAPVGSQTLREQTRFTQDERETARGRHDDRTVGYVFADQAPCRQFTACRSVFLQPS